MDPLPGAFRAAGAVTVEPATGIPPLMPTVFCIGIATLDYVYGVPAMPTRPVKYRAGALEVVGGGIAANASVAVARLGGTAMLATRLGDDLTGDAIRAELAAEHVDLSPSTPVTGRRSPVSAVIVDPAGERMLISYADPAMPADPGWLPAALPARVGAVLGDTRWEEGAARLFALARSAGVPGVLDGDRKPLLAESLEAPSHIAFSETGLAELTGKGDPEEGLKALSSRVGWIAVTSGARGVHVLSAGRVTHHPAFPVKAVDTLGAGDTWHGAFAFALADGMDEARAVRFASAAAAIKCTRFGGRKGAPTRAEVETFLGERS
jgi:sulfofructose kinase